MTPYTPGTPCWADLSSPSVEESARFYAGVFGWTPETATEPEAMGYTTFRIGDQAVCAVGPLMAEGQPAAWTTYFATDDADAFTQRVDASGGKVLMAPMDVMGYGRMAVYLDPAGAAFACWQAGTMAGADTIGAPNTLHWFELSTRDPEASKPFYRDVTGLTPRDVDFGDMTYTIWELGEVQLGGMMPMPSESPADVPAHWMVYFGVEDCDATAARVAELGGTVMVPPMDSGPGRMAVLSDPHGAAFSIIKANPDFRA